MCRAETVPDHGYARSMRLCGPSKANAVNHIPMKATYGYITLHDRRFRLCVSRDRIEESIEELAVRMNADYGDGSKGVPLFIVVLKGAFMFASELLQRITFPCEVSFVRMSSYSGISSSGLVKEAMGLDEDILGRHIVIVEDIVDTGETILSLIRRLEAMRPAGIEVASLLFKSSSYRKDIPIKYAAMEAPEGFVVGFGLDYDGLGRNLASLYTIADEKA